MSVSLSQEDVLNGVSIYEKLLDVVEDMAEYADPAFEVSFRF